MSKAELLIRYILGPVRINIRPLVCAVEHTIVLLFVKKIPMDDILVTKDIYPEVARMLGRQGCTARSVSAVARRIERLANLCWEALASRDLVTQYIGAPIKDIRAPRDMLFYLAFYVHLDTPFYVAIHQQSSLLF